MSEKEIINFKKQKINLVRYIIFMVSLLIFIQIDFVVNFFVNLIELFEKYFSIPFLKLSNVARLYEAVKLIVIALILILSSILLTVIGKQCQTRKNYKPSPTNKDIFESSLHNYLNDANQHKGYLITGDWGSGKTYKLKKFIDKFYKYSNRPIYNISCYGLDNRELVIKEIKNELERHENFAVNWIKYIPVMGELLYGIVKEFYSLENIPKDTVFIFDDFERITSINHTFQSNPPYKEHKREEHNSLVVNGNQEFLDINEEFQELSFLINKHLREEYNLLSQTSLNKYNAVTGLINEMIENYQFKVIIICNVDVLGYDFMDDIFRSKLECFTFNLQPDKGDFINIFFEAFKNRTFNDQETKIEVKNIIGEIAEEFYEVWKNFKIKNLRLVKSLVYNYLSTIDKISNYQKLDKFFLISLFYSIFITMKLRDEENLNLLKVFQIGGNMRFYLTFYNLNDLENDLYNSRYYDKLKWCGLTVSGLEVLNFSIPSNISHLLSQFNSYPYNDVENELVKLSNEDAKEVKANLEVFDSRDITRFNLLPIHIQFVLKHESMISEDLRSDTLNHISKKVKSLLAKELENFSNQNNIDIKQTVRQLLISMDNALSSGTYYYNFIYDWIQVIYEKTRVSNIQQDSIKNRQTITTYNEYVENINSN